MGLRPKVGGQDMRLYKKFLSVHNRLALAPPELTAVTLINPDIDLVPNGDKFGFSTAIYGTQCVVGAPGESQSGSAGGQAYVFDVATGTITRSIGNPNAYLTRAGDQFGTAVAISDKYIVVSAPSEYKGTTYSDSGVVYVFSATTGAKLWTLINPNAYNLPTGDKFGGTLSLYGDQCLVGAFREDDAGGSTSGKAYLFDLTTGGLLWTVNNPTSYGTSSNDQFALGVALHGNLCAVGAAWEDASAVTDSGVVYLFNTTSRVVSRILANPNAYGTKDSDRFGYSVALNSTICAVGAISEDDETGTSSGKVYVFDTASGVLLHTLSNPNHHGATTSDLFGRVLAVNESILAVGALHESSANGTDAGVVYLFDLATGALSRTIENPNPTSTLDYFGYSVALSDTHCSVGAYGTDVSGTATGKAYIFPL